MELRKNTEVFFDPVSHSYTNSEGKLLLGVTELLHKHGLAPDLSGIPDATLNAAAEKGKRVHEYLQAYEAGEMVQTSDLLDEYKALGLHHIASEFLISDNEIVASSIDMIYEARENEVIIVDIKTTEKKNLRYVAWQTSIYRELFERQNPGVKVAGQYLLWCDKKCEKLRGFIPLNPVPTEEVNALLDAERNGLIYIDEHATEDASLVLPEEELSAYVANAKVLSDLKEQVKLIEAKLSEYDAKLLDYMNEHNLDEMAAPGGIFKRKAAYTQERADTAALKSKFPAVWEKVRKTVAVKGSVTFKPTE